MQLMRFQSGSGCLNLLRGRLPGVGAMALATAVLAAGFLTPALAQERYQLDEGQWLKQTDLDPDSSEGKLQAIRKHMAQDQPGKAKELADRWIESYPNHPLLAEAYLLRGDARVAKRDYYKALFDYEYLVRSYPASDAFFTALEREYHVATVFASGVKRKLWGMPIIGAGGEAEELFIRIQERAPGSPLGEKASLALGDFYFGRSQMGSAAEAYDLFLQNYPRSVYRERVMLQLISANLATFKGPRHDATGLIDASARIKAFGQEFPASAERLGMDARLVRIDESLALKTYYNGRWYEKTDKDVSAVYMYQRVVSDHPQTAAAQLALDRLESLGAPPTLGEFARPSGATPPAEQPTPTAKPAPENVDVGPTGEPAPPTVTPLPEPGPPELSGDAGVPLRPLETPEPAAEPTPEPSEPAAAQPTEESAQEEPQK